MALAVIIQPTLRATMAWYVRRRCNRVSDHMERGAMTPVEPHVQQDRCDPTRGAKSSGIGSPYNQFEDKDTTKLLLGSTHRLRSPTLD